MLSSRAFSSFLPSLVLLVASTFCAQAFATTNTTLTVNCTFTITASINIQWTGAGVSGAPTTAAQTWAIGAATLAGTYCSDGGTWTAASPIEILNSSATGAVGIAFSTAASGWTQDVYAGGGQSTVNHYAAAVLADASDVTLATTILGTSGNVAPQNSTWMSLAAGATSLPLIFAVQMPTTISSGAGSGQTIAFTFTATAQ